jgi:ABC-type transport system involved in multi-copper enzyme maturation permease subunit
MYTLIKREIEDHIIYFLGALILSLLFTASIAAKGFGGEPAEGLGIILAAIGITLACATIVICALGTSQMHTDKNRKISAFLSTLPVSRNQILAARVITGLLALLVLLAAPAITVEILLSTLRQEEAVYRYFTVEIFSAVYLLGLGVYCTGLMCGFSSSKIVVTLGSLVLSVVLLTIILIKGPDIETLIILLVYVSASLAYTWRKFSTIPFI